MMEVWKLILGLYKGSSFLQNRTNIGVEMIYIHTKITIKDLRIIVQDKFSLVH